MRKGTLIATAVLLLLGAILWLSHAAVMMLIAVTPEYEPARQGSIPSVTISPSPNDQREPAIDGFKVVWSEKIDGYWQIVLYDLEMQSRRQITSDAFDHIRPSISGDKVIWWQGEAGGADFIGGMDCTTGLPLALPITRVAQPKIDHARIVWSGNIDTVSLINPIVLFDVNTQVTETIVQTRGGFWPDVSGDIVVWMDLRNGTPDIYGYDLQSKQEFEVVVADGEQAMPNTDGRFVVWQDARRDPGSNDYDIFGYDMREHREFVVSARKGDERSPKVDGDYVVWFDFVGSNVDVYAYDLQRHTLLTIAADEHANGDPDISGGIVVWTQYERPNDRYARSQILLGQITTQP